MPNIALSETRVKALRPRRSACGVRDAKLGGFGVRVLPSGAERYFIHTRHCGIRVWRMVGDASAITVDEARARAAGSVFRGLPERLRPAIRNGYGVDAGSDMSDAGEESIVMCFRTRCCHNRPDRDRYVAMAGPGGSDLTSSPVFPKPTATTRDSG